MPRMKACAIGVATLCGFVSIAWAVPSLQLYLEGGVYDSTTESWFIDQEPDHLRLWVIALTPINDVKLAVAYEADTTATLSFLGSTTGGLGGFEDPSVPAAPLYLRTVTDGSLPKLGDGSDLPGHGVYGPATDWQEYSLGDFIQADSPIADFIDSFPTPGNHRGQINVYELSVSADSWLHFDVYDHIVARNHARYVFAPFSHDATTPEPATAVMLLMAGGLPLLLIRPRR